MTKAVIFDVDGVLLDSFEANFLFFKELFKRNNFNPPTKEEFSKIFHRPMRDVIKTVTGLEDEAKVTQIWEEGKSGEFDTPEADLSPGAEETIKKLSQSYLLGIATSRVKTHEFEGSLVKLKRYFKATATYEETENHKPHPDPLLLVAKKLGVLPEECVYIGDVENDALAARAAGMKVIIYSDTPVAGVDGQTADFKKIPELIKKL